MRNNFTLILMAEIKKKDHNGGEDGKKFQMSYIAGGNIKWVSHFRKQFGGSSKS